MEPIKASRGLTMDQILNNTGFTLDTSDFVDPREDIEDDRSEFAHLTSEEMLRHLNLEDDDCNTDDEQLPLMAMTFDEIREKMQPIDNDEQVFKLITKQGSGNIVPQEAQVTVKYVGYFEAQDEPFDSTYLHPEKKAVFRLGRGEMLPGVDIAIGTMKKFEKSVFLITPSLAYGELGCPPRVPANAEVLFKIELIDYMNKQEADDFEELTNEEKKKFAIASKRARNILTIGMDYFKKRKYKPAIREYNKAVDYLETAHLETNEEEEQMNKMLSRTLTNLIICYNKVDKPKLACASFERLTSKSGKAYFHYSKALMTLGEHESAMKFLQKAHRLLPENPDVKKLIVEVDTRLLKDKEYEKRFAKNSLRSIGGTDSDTFEATAVDMCDEFIKSTLLRQAIPSNLSAEELHCLQRIAATRELSITTQTYREVETHYLTKKIYFATN